MNSKEAKKIRQAYRRDYRKNIVGSVSMLQDCLKERPKWIHKKIWRWLISFFFDIDKFEDMFFKK